MDKSNRFTKKDLGYVYAIGSALLFGSSIPASKYLLGEMPPILLAGLLYLTGGFGLLCFIIFRKFSVKFSKPLSLKPKDWKWLIGATLFGGILAPILLLTGLSKIKAVEVALYSNLESIFTAMLAWFIFKEPTDKKSVLGVFLIILGSVIVAWKDISYFHTWTGPTFVIIACFFWALDNNMLHKISNTDPLFIAAFKSVVAGLTNTSLGLVLEHPSNITLFPFLETFLLGFFSYGVGITLFILALRDIGAAKTSAYYSLAPFIGLFLSILFLKESVSTQFTLAAILIAFGISLHFARSVEK